MALRNPGEEIQSLLRNVLLFRGGLQVTLSFICPLVLAGGPSLGHPAWARYISLAM